MGAIRLTALPAMKPRRESACRTECPIRLLIWPPDTFARRGSREFSGSESPSGRNGRQTQRTEHRVSSTYRHSLAKTYATGFTSGTPLAKLHVSCMEDMHNRQ